MNTTKPKARSSHSTRVATPLCLTILAACALLGLILLTCSSSTFAQSGPSSQLAAADTLPDSPAPNLLDAGQEQPKAPGTVTGKVIGPDGIGVAGAKLTLIPEGQPTGVEALTGDDGQFLFTNVPPGAFQLSISSEGFKANTYTGVLHSAEHLAVPAISMILATTVTKVSVEMSQLEIAQAQMNDEMRQRVLGVIPNFYVTYVPDAAPLTTKQKYHLSLRLTIDPAYLILAGGVAGVQQARNEFSGYGQGAAGYGKRYGATLADFTISNLLGNAVFPAVFKQDPRYFYKGTGSVKSRALYALANAVICKSDSRKWQFNYSYVLGSLAAGGISNLYYPASDRSARLTFENTAIGIGGEAILNLMKEFVLTKVSSNVPARPNPNTP